MPRQRKKRFIDIETIVILIIAGCIIFLNAFTTSKFDELDAAGESAMFVREDLDYSDDEQLIEEILPYRPNFCKMIEMYNSDMKLLFSLRFDEVDAELDYDLEKYPDLLKMLQENEEGQAKIEYHDEEENVSFQWIVNSEGERRLVIIYSAKPKVHNIWVFTFICYIILILIFVLLIRLHSHHYSEKIQLYKQVSGSMR